MASRGYGEVVIAEWLDGMRAFTLVGHEKDITCPILIIAGEREYEPARLEEEMVQWQKVMNHPKSQIRIGTASEGGEGHCLVNNLLLMNQIEMDWLDDVLSGGGEPVTFDGEFYWVTDPTLAAAPTPPIWVAALGPKTLAVTGRHAHEVVPAIRDVIAKR